MSMQAFRYEADELVPCEYRGEAFLEIVPSAPKLDLSWLAPVPSQDTGIYSVDLQKEAARSGVPTWWRPELSRRARNRAWGSSTQAQRTTAMQYLFEPSFQTREMRAHRVAWQIGKPRYPEGPVPRAEAVLYLPRGEDLTQQHLRDVMRRASLGGSR